MLWIIFDDKLKWTTHIKPPAKIKINVIKTLADHIWEANQKSLLINL